MDMTEYKAQSNIPHDSARLHVTGDAQYVDDLVSTEGTLHLAFGLSKVACGKIISVGLEPVWQSQGVVKVLLCTHLPAVNDVSPSPYWEPLLAKDNVEYIGQPIFLVIADTNLNARKAARKAIIEIEEIKPLLTIDEALEANSLFEDPLVYQNGNPESAVDTSPKILSGEIEMGGQEHFYLEGQVAMAIPQENDGMLVYSSTQHPSEVQHKVADSLGVPMNKVRVEVRRMGGGFGGKESQANSVACACAIAANLTGRPCRFRYDRDDDFLITGKRHDCRITYRVGFDEAGKINGVIIDQFIRCGWSLDLSLPVADRAMLHSDNAYFLPASKITSYRLKTNTQSATAFRGFGGPQGMVGIERIMDHIAHELEMDPLDVRRINFYNPPNSGALQRTHYGMEVEDCIIEEIVDELVSTSDYRNRRQEINEWNDKNPFLKKGIALTPVKFGISFTLTHLNQAGSLVHVYRDGSIHLNHGGTEMGQGLMIKIAQIAANTFDQPVGSVRITPADTDKVPNTSATAASSGTDINGMATKIACTKIIDRLIGFLAERHQSYPDEVRFEQGEFKVQNETYDFKEVINDAYMNRISLSATGFYSTPKLHWDRKIGKGRPFFYFAYGAAVSEVMIDVLTGENKLLRADIIHDVGNSVNPAIDLGQVEGGFVQGYGWLTTEELYWDSNGYLRTHAPSTYKIPACRDRPMDLRVKLWEKGWNREETIFNSKAVGEPPLMLGISVFLALSNAIASITEDYPSLNAPATPERILNTLTRNYQVPFDFKSGRN